jgi:hypothetical protein
MPTTVTISEFQPGPGECNFLGTTAKLRRYYNQDWSDIDGVFHAEGVVGSSTSFFDEISCTLAANTITVPTFPATPTDNPQTGSNVQETWQLWDQSGSPRNIIFEGFIPSANPTITFGALLLLNKGQTLFESDAITRLDQWIQSYIDTVIGALNKATSVIFGRVRLSVPASDLTDPVVVGKNDYASTANSGIGKSSVNRSPASDTTFVEATDPRLPVAHGTAILVAGEATVAFSSIEASSVVDVTSKSNQVTGSLRALITAGVGFAIKSSNGADSGPAGYTVAII